MIEEIIDKTADQLFESDRDKAIFRRGARFILQDCPSPIKDDSIKHFLSSFRKNKSQVIACDGWEYTITVKPKKIT